MGALYSVFAASTRGGAVRAALSWLRIAGFQRARFYALGYQGDGSRADAKLVLVDQSPADPALVAGRFAQPPSMSLLDPDPARWRRPKSCDGNLIPRTRRVPPLDLAGYKVVNVPVQDGSTIVGMLAADWRGDLGDLEERDLDALLLLATTLGTRYRRDVVARFAALDLPESGSPDWIASVVAGLRRALRAGAGCAFRYDWIRGRLVLEPGSFDSARSSEAKLEPPNESYRLDEFESGADWIDRKSSARPRLVNQESRLWHRNLLDAELHTVLYERLGERDARYLLRFINRDDSPKLPFFTDRLLLHQACERLTAVLDSEYSLRVTQAINRLGESTSSPLDEGNLRAAVNDTVRHFGIDTWALVGTRADGVLETFVSAGIADDRDATSGLPVWPTSVEMLLDEEPVDEAQEVSDDIFLLALAGQRSSTCADMRRRGFTHFLCVRAVLIELSVGFLIPIRRDPPADLADIASELVSHVPHTLDSTSLMLGLLGRVTVDRRFDVVRGAGLNIVRYLQHEIGTSMLSLVTEASNTLQSAANAIVMTPRGERVPDSAVWRIREDNARLKVMLSTAARTFGVTNFLIGTDKLLQLQMKSLPVLSVVRDAVAGVRARFPDLMLRQFDITPFEVKFDEARVRAIGDACVDRACLVPALIALLDNAVKYSITRYPPDRVTIDFGVRRDGNWLFFEVLNWGLPIPEGRRGMIFEPFTRGGHRHYRRAVPGLGIGLFLARQVARAHQGDVALRESSPTLADPNRRYKEGFRTRFELWVSCDLAEGIVNWDPQKGVIR